MSQPSYQTLNGYETTAEDGQRGIWYGTCTYWTDDWNKLSKSLGTIPCCPACHAPGFQITAKEWFSGAARFEGAGNERYRIFLNQSKEQCKKPEKFLDWYKRWLAENPLRAS